jgi:hypothetical protein
MTIPERMKLDLWQSADQWQSYGWDAWRTAQGSPLWFSVICVRGMWLRVPIHIYRTLWRGWGILVLVFFVRLRASCRTQSGSVTRLTARVRLRARLVSNKQLLSNLRSFSTHYNTSHNILPTARPGFGIQHMVTNGILPSGKIPTVEPGIEHGISRLAGRYSDH